MMEGVRCVVWTTSRLQDPYLDEKQALPLALSLSVGWFPARWVGWRAYAVSCSWRSGESARNRASSAVLILGGVGEIRSHIVG